MFGYISIDKPELKIKDYICYRSYYCGLCHALQESYGKIGQLTLSYDMTFLVLLLTGLYEPETSYDEMRCITHPVEKHPSRQNEMSEYVAAMNIILSYHKCLDDWIDEKKYSKWIFAKLLEKNHKKVNEKYGDKAQLVFQLLEDIHKVEKDKDQSIDKAAGYFGEIMAELFAYKEDQWEGYLRKIGFFLGKFIYLLDAYEDMEKDSITNNYNVFLLTLAEQEGQVSIQNQKEFVISPEVEEKCQQILGMMMAECAREFEKLPILENIDILRNIIYSGVWSRYELVKQKRVRKQEEDVKSI